MPLVRPFLELRLSFTLLGKPVQRCGPVHFLEDLSTPRGPLQFLRFPDNGLSMPTFILLARSSLPSLQTLYIIAGIFAVIAGVLYSRMSMS